jgi:hypothetical protein
MNENIETGVDFRWIEGYCNRMTTVRYIVLCIFQLIIISYTL